jgi:hypothetical protein
LSLHQSLQKILFDRVQQNADIVNGFRHLVLVTLTPLPQEDRRRCDRRYGDHEW